MKVTLIRHTSVDVPQGTCYGQTDVPVKSSFSEEAALVKSNLATYLPFDKVYCSPLTRAVKLASYCGFPDAQRDVCILELNMGDWEMKSYDDINGPLADIYFKDYFHVPTPNGESFEMQYRRVSHFLDELKQQPYQNVAVFSHGGVLICAQIYAGLIPLEKAFSGLVDYGGIIQIEI